MVIDGVDLTQTLVTTAIFLLMVVPISVWYLSKVKPGIAVRNVDDDSKKESRKPELVPCRFYFSDATSECRPVPEHKMESLVSYSRAWEKLDQYERTVEVIEDLQTGTMYFVGRE